MKEAREVLKNNQHKPTTQIAYHKIWTNFNNFVVRLDYPPKFWEERVSLYCAYLTINTDIQSSTLKTYVSAIKSKLVSDNYPWNQELVYFTAITKACKLQNDVVRIRLPMHKKLLECSLFEVERKFEIINKDLYKSALFKTVFLTGYYGLFRIRELTESHNVIKAVDVHEAKNKNKYLFVLHTSKTHSRANPPQKIWIEDDELSASSFSPTQEIKNYLQFRGGRLNDEEQFFVTKTKFLCKVTKCVNCYVKSWKTLA